MKSKKPVTATPTSGREFRAGQIWKIGEMNVAVTMVGKLLVHYRQYKTHSRGSGISLCSKTEFERYLMKGKAVLATENGAEPKPAADGVLSKES